MRRCAVLLLAVVALAACGGSGNKGSSGPSTQAQTNGAQAQIESAYVKFFAGLTPVSDRVALLQNGQRFKKLVTSYASDPLTETMNAKVFSVKLQGSNKARVVYAIHVNGTALPRQTGTAVRENGTWKVGDDSLCKLLAMGGPTPSVCKS